MATSRRARSPRELRRQDRIALLLVVLAAVVAGVLAGALASPQPWQNETTTGAR